MSPIPGEPHDPKPQELDLKDGRKVKFSFPGMPARPEPLAGEQRGGEEPPRDDPRPPINPNHAGG